MLAQSDLFDPPRARRSDPATSHAAAAQASGLAHAHQQRILSALRLSLVPLGAEQIGVLANLEPYQARKRLAELHQAGRIALAPGERKTLSGRSERLWRLA
jgi:hypothetical protein